MRERRAIIIRTLCNLSRLGWLHATPDQYRPLETELRVIENALARKGGRK